MSVGFRFHRSPAVAATIMVALLAGCAATKRVVARPKMWDRYANGDPLQVYGADRTTAGPLILEELKQYSRVKALVASQGEPDTVQVLGARRSPKRFVLTYKRRGAGRPRQIQLDPSEEGYVPRDPEFLATPSSASKPTPRRPRRSPSPTATPADAGVGVPSGDERSEPVSQATPVARMPTQQQMLECPIDRDNPACQALCTPGATYEWCR